MYSELIVDQNIHALKKAGYKPTPRSVEDSIEISRKLQALIKPDGTPTRVFLPKEIEFMRSELMLCRSDFRYWALRYGHIELDSQEGRGSAPISFWASQERTLHLMGQREEEIMRTMSKRGFSEGIKLVWHKARQEGATALGRLICGHRMTMFKGTRGLAASMDETKVHELYVRDKVVLDNLPSFLLPKIEFDVKDSHIGFESKSRLSYQKASQSAGIGTGQKFDAVHLTELALWPNADRVEFDLFPAIGNAPHVFVGFESTANGRSGFWYEFTENVRKKKHGFESWTYSFTPYYIEPKKYRRDPHPGWEPADHTKAHAEMVETTSILYAGKTMRPTRDQLYWWETEREMFRKQDSLNVFFSNYCATPEESFQHSTRPALPFETIEWMRTTSLMGMPYATDNMPRHA